MLEETEEIVLTYEGSIASDVEMTSESTAIEINERHNNEGSVNDLDDNIAKFMREKQKEYKERVFTNIDGKLLNTSPDSYYNETMGTEMKLSDAESQSLEHVENLKILIHNYCKEVHHERKINEDVVN